MTLTRKVAFLHACYKCHYRGKATFPSKSKTAKDTKKFSHTILLPKTRFPHRLTTEKRVQTDLDVIKIMKRFKTRGEMLLALVPKPGAGSDDELDAEPIAEMRKGAVSENAADELDDWTDNQINQGFSELYTFQRSKAECEEFVLHDGPPYANGVPHMGHAINKILKDIVIRWNLLSGKKIHFVPGWDCHGLPIEMKVLSSENLKRLSPLEIRKKAREFAKRTISEQKHVFQSWGVMADWDGPGGCYQTFDSSYVTNQLEQFYKLYEKGLIYRNLKPVYWSPSARTALAESELEYNSNHKSTATTVRLKVLNAPESWCGGDDLFALIWTTTPWTLPANQAIAYNPEMEYSIVQDGSGSRFLLASSLVTPVSTKLCVTLHTVLQVKGEALENLKYEHPFSHSPHSFFPGSHVTADVGTGLVHTAPSHGHDDFLIGINNNLPLQCMVDEEGDYTRDAGHGLEGLNVLRDGNAKILSLLQENILHKEDFIHSYPYDWRTKRPVIIRSSLQWFIDTNSIKKAAIDALQRVEILPTRNVEGMIAQMERRPYWCISRQRSWGVPIPVLYKNDQPIINSELIEHYKLLTSQHGTDFWWTLPLVELIPKALHKSIDPQVVSKGEDILDIWLDSGLSWSSVLGGKTADVYLEGVDQFTGWFQSSLITSVALQGKAPYSKVVVHGFAVDENGRKMSKSLGNVVNPQDITRGGPNLKQDSAYGVDVLRWWVASHGLQHTTISVSNRLLDECAENLKRLRNILKFMLGSINDLPETVVYDHPPLSAMDKYFLLLLQDFESRINEHYSGYQYNRVCTSINNFVANELSSFYCHVTKDKLYCDGSRSNRRKAVQYVMYHALNTLTKAFGPILPVLAEELYSYHPHKTEKSSPYFYEYDRIQSIHLNMDNSEKSELKACFQLVKSIKETLYKEMPVNLKSSEVTCKLKVDSPTYEALKLLQEEGDSYDSDLTFFLQVSSVSLKKDDDVTGYELDVRATDYSLCDRCRRFCVVGSEDICDRCEDVLEVLPTVDVSSI